MPVAAPVMSTTLPLKSRKSPMVDAYLPPVLLRVLFFVSPFILFLLLVPSRVIPSRGFLYGKFMASPRANSSTQTLDTNLHPCSVRTEVI
jgi:hypothetical protein